MIGFLLGFLVVSFAAASGALATDWWGAEALSGEQRVWLFLVLGIAPVVGAAAVAGVIDWWRPRRFLAPVHGLGVARVARGFVAAAITIALYTGALPFLDAFAPGELFVLSASPLGSSCSSRRGCGRGSVPGAGTT